MAVETYLKVKTIIDLLTINSMSKQEIIIKTGFNVPTIYIIIRELLDCNIIEMIGMADHHNGEDIRLTKLYKKTN